MKFNPVTRRHFLQGSGKAALVLPVLPSLLSAAEARAQAASVQKNFIGVAMQHGGWANMMSTSDGSPSVYMPMFKNMTPYQPAGRHLIHSKTLEAAKTDGGGRVSEMIDAAFNPYLSKMSLLHGFDITHCPMSHHYSHFGNTGASPAPVGSSARPPQATVDQVMAYSSNFYKNPALLGKSTAWTGNFSEWGYYNSYTWANPGDKKASPIVGVGAVWDPQTLWDKYFKNFVASGAPPPPAAPTLRQKLADRVLGDYKSFRTNPRLGGEDRTRLDRHIELLNDTEKSLHAVKTAPASCTGAPLRPPAFMGTDPDPNKYPSQTFGYDTRKQMLAAMNNVIVSLIACGLCHSFTSHFESLLSDDVGAWHAWAHARAPENKMQGNAILHDVVLDLVAKLDQGGLLDSSLVIAVNEHAMLGHQAHGLSLAAFGSAGGAIKTGQYIDYRNWSGHGDDKPDPAGTGGTMMRWGYPMPQFMANVLMAMDVPSSEFEPLNRDTTNFFGPTNSGYGSNFLGTYDASVPSLPNVIYPRFKGANLSEWLPLLKA